jgi:hypothetical protein
MSFAVVKVGTEDRPAGVDDLDEMVDLIRAASDSNYAIVTHDAVKIKTIDCPAGHIIVYKVGSPKKPATEANIKWLREEITSAHADRRPIVMPHDVEIEFLQVK